MQSAIRFEEVTKRYGSQLALDWLALQVEPGEILGFLGPNGAGKTTSIRLLLDLIRPTSGRASILGVDCQRASQRARKLVGYLPGDLRLYPSLKGREMVELVGSLREKHTDWNYIAELVARLELNLDHRIATYSKGTRQKLGLLLALLGRPPVLLLDEPTSGLDPIMQNIVWTMLREQVASGTTVFFSSHILSEVEHICDRVAILRAGKLVAAEPVTALKARIIRHIVVTFAGPMPDGELTATEAKILSRTDTTLTLVALGDLDRLLKVLSHYHVADLSIERLGLDDIILAYYRPESVPS